MEYTKFFGRENELKLFQSGLDQPQSFFLVLYGRRRVGKTTLIQHFFSTRRGLYLVGRQETQKDQLTRISSQIASYFNEKLFILNPFNTWDAVFTYLFEKHADVPIILDEFPYMIQSQPALPSTLQEYWDKYTRDRKLYLILCGSSLSMMESLLGYQSPIYGRRTHQLLLEPLNFMETRNFYPNCTKKKQIEFYAVFGGTPAYNLKINSNLSIEENIQTAIFPQNQFLYQEPLFVLREEVNEPRLYFSVLKSIASGNTRMNEIVNDTGLNKSLISKYLSVLQELQLIERRIPITETKPEKSRKGIYMLKDPFFGFWFRFIFPYNHLLDQNQDEYLLRELILPHLNKYIGLQFEEICIQWMKKQNPQYLIGRWWDNTKEVDILGFTPDQKEGIIAEVKWSDLESIDIIRIFSDMEQNIQLINMRETHFNFYIIARTIKMPKTKLKANYYLITVEML